MKSLNWASLGCGVIANELAVALNKNGKKLYSIANRTKSKAEDFAKKHNIEKVYENIDDLFLDNNVDIIYISTPHNTHLPLIIKALENKKHVLCEKAITLNSDELDVIMKLAQKNGLILAEAMTIYHMPIYKKIEDTISSKKLGKLQFAQINFGSYKPYDMNNRFFNKNLAGGALLDIGVYALSLLRMFVSSNPTNISSQIRYAPSGVDEQVGILLMNDEGEMATITLSLHAKQPKRATLSFEEGFIEIFDYPRAQSATITFTCDGRKEIIEDGKTEDALYYEILDMENAVNSNKNIMKIEYTKDVMEIMTNLRKEWNFKYPEEE